MISNDDIRRLLGTDRETLIELMLAAYLCGANRGGNYALWHDPDFRSLIGAVRERASAEAPSFGPLFRQRERPVHE
jgi:hypothetical protein